MLFKKRRWYIVTVTHVVSGGGGFTSPVLFTTSLRKAVETARNPEELGYNMVHTDINGALIYEMKQGKTYCREELFVSHYRISQVVVARFYQETGTKKEEWFNKDRYWEFRQIEKEKTFRKEVLKNA